MTTIKFEVEHEGVVYQDSTEIETGRFDDQQAMYAITDVGIELWTRVMTRLIERHAANIRERHRLSDLAKDI